MNPLFEPIDAPEPASINYALPGLRPAHSFPLSRSRCRTILRFSIVVALFTTAFNTYCLWQTIGEAQKWFHRPGQVGEPADVLGPIIFGSAGLVLLLGFLLPLALVCGAGLIVRGSRLGVGFLWVYFPLQLGWVALATFAVVWVARDGVAFWLFSTALFVVMFSVISLMALLLIRPHADAL